MKQFNMIKIVARFFIGLSLLTAISTAAQDAPPLQSEFLLQIVLDTEPAQTLGARRIVPITGGVFSGPTLKGKVLPGGADWIKTRPDGVNDLDVRITLQTDTGELIFMSYKGILSSSDKGLYWRMVPTFETASEKHAGLNNIIAVGMGLRVDGKTAYNIYRIL